MTWLGRALSWLKAKSLWLLAGLVVALAAVGAFLASALGRTKRERDDALLREDSAKKSAVRDRNVVDETKTIETNAEVAHAEVEKKAEAELVDVREHRNDINEAGDDLDALAAEGNRLREELRRKP